MTIIPKTMRAAILVEQKSPLVIVEVELPRQLQFGQVLVEIFFSGICGSQLGEIDGVKGPDPWLPHLLGHEGSGKILAIGEGVTTVQPGDKVVLHWMEGSGLPGSKPVYRWQGKPCNAGWVTTFNEYAVCAENRVTKLPQDFPMYIAPLLGCAVTTGLGVINNKANVKIGQSVAVFGAGGVGLNVVQGAALSGAYPIIAVDLLDNRLALARKVGASHVVNASKNDAVQFIQEIVGSLGVDVAVDNTGDKRVIETAYNITKPYGKTILVGVPSKGDEIRLYTLPLHFGKELTGTKGGETDPTEDIPNYVRLYSSGRLELDCLVTDRYPLKEINEAIGAIRSGKVAGRVIVDMADT